MKKVLLPALLLFAGCSEQIQVHQEDPIDQVIAITFDTSGSFMEHSDLAYIYCGRVVQEFKRQAAGGNSRILLSQISGSSEALIFNGSIRSFNQKFPTKEAFKAYLVSKGNNGGSRVNDSASDTVEKLIAMHKENPGMKSCYVCLSDLEDNISAPKSRERLADVLRSYAKCGGVVAFHWVHGESTAEAWRVFLKEAEFRSFSVTSGIETEPPVPRF